MFVATTTSEGTTGGGGVRITHVCGHTNSKLKCVALCVGVCVWTGERTRVFRRGWGFFDAYERVRSGYVDVDGVVCKKRTERKGGQR
jgi:hypothetical protein